MDSKEYYLRQLQHNLDAELKRQARCRVFLETCGMIALMVIAALAGAWVFAK